MVNFNDVVDRKGTDSFKWDYGYREFDSEEEQNAAKEAVPMWIADMDFQVPEAVQKAIQRVVDHGVYGYTAKNESFFLSLKDWLYRRHGWDVKREWMDFSPGVLPGITACVRAFTQPGDKIIIQTPVYYPFRDIVLTTGRQLSENRLVEDHMKYRMDFEDLERKAAEPRTKMLILCSPHNPVGRVWEKEELEKLGEICRKYHLLIVSDEIHSDLIIGEKKHIPAGMILEGVYDRHISFYAPSKTFNLAGLQTSGVIIPDGLLHEAYKAAMRETKIYSGTPFGLAAFEAAYTGGEEWLEQLLKYLRGNYRYLQEYLKAELPQIQAAPLEGTYLVWLNFRNCGVRKEDLDLFLLKEAKLMLDFGDWFDEGYLGYGRMNIACPRTVLQKGLEQLKEALKMRGE